VAAQSLDLVIEQGKTLSRVIRWESSVRAWKAITAIGNVAPMLVTAVGHGMPDGWRAAITDVVGMIDANAGHNPPWDSELKPATYVGVDQVSFDDVSAAGFDAYVSGGYLFYYVPVSLATMTARMNIKDQIGGTELVSLTTQAGSGFVVDDTNKTITLTITAADTEAFTWTEGVYDLEMVDSSDDSVVAIFSGSITVTDEVTTS